MRHCIHCFRAEPRLLSLSLEARAGRLVVGWTWCVMVACKWLQVG